MTWHGWAQFGVVATLFLVLTPLLGGYMARVYAGGPAAGDRLLLPLERLLYRIAGVAPEREQRWTAYALSLLAFSLCSWLLLYALLRLQGLLPLNPAGRGRVPPALAFNTALSFVSNTNWQNYSGEATLSHFSQMAGLTVQNFVSAAAGMAVLVALARGLARRRGDTVGNFWVDLVRTTTRILLPTSLIAAVLLAGQGVLQNFGGFVEVQTLEGGSQLVPGGPAASQVAIKELGTNGGGFFGANAAVPLENPTPVSNLLQTVLIGLIPFALADTLRAADRQSPAWVGPVRGDVHAVGRVGDRGDDAGGPGEPAPGCARGRSGRVR